MRSERLALIARSVGCIIEDSSAIVAVSGEAYAGVSVRCRDNDHAIELLNALAVDDATGQISGHVEPDIVELGERFRLWKKQNHKNDTDLAILVQTYVREMVDFVEEDGEKFRSPSLTLKLGSGDCDDHAHLVVSIALAAGLQAKAVAVRDEEGDITHVAAQILTEGEWHWAETTFPAEFGEEPRAAARRLGILRKDVA